MRPPGARSKRSGRPPAERSGPSDPAAKPFVRHPTDQDGTMLVRSRELADRIHSLPGSADVVTAIGENGACGHGGGGTSITRAAERSYPGSKSPLSSPGVYPNPALKDSLKEALRTYSRRTRSIAAVFVDAPPTSSRAREQSLVDLDGQLHDYNHIGGLPYS